LTEWVDIQLQNYLSFILTEHQNSVTQTAYILNDFSF